MPKGTFVTAISCIDGRTVEPETAWLKQFYKAKYIDLITEPGPEKKLTCGSNVILDEIREKVTISVEAHNSHFVVVIGHYDCAGNPVSEVFRKKQLSEAAQIIRSWDLPVNEVKALYVNENWKLEEV